MMNIKNNLKKTLIKFDNLKNKKLSYVKRIFNKDKNKYHNKLSKAFLFFNYYKKTKKFCFEGDYFKLFNNLDISFNNDDFYFYSLDIFKYFEKKSDIYSNCSPDYSLFIENSLNDLVEKNFINNYCKDKNNLIMALQNYLNRIIRKITKSKNNRKAIITSYLQNFMTCPAKSVDESLQRILIINQLLWQTNHTLIGLNRLDKILNRFVEADKCSDDELINLFYNFIKTLHKYYNFKSAALLGDTGQIIILGGREEDGTYFCNRYTYLIIKALIKANLPDPKILLRVSSNTPDSLLSLSLECINTGIGSPLFSNDDLAIKSLIEFGYDKCDAYNYTTSACWELIPANCFEQNNIREINFTEPFNMMGAFDNLDKISSFDEFFEMYLRRLEDHVNFIVMTLENQTWQYDPLLSLCQAYCSISKKDLSNCGGKYNNYGILSIGLSNAVNSILIIEKIVFEMKLLSYKEFNRLRNNNYYEHDDLIKLIKNIKISKFGDDDEKVVNVTNTIIDIVSKTLSLAVNNQNAKFKFGLSSPGYIMASYCSRATFDGRLANTPYATHISNDSSSSYTSLINFTSSLNYLGNRFNGNVLDMMLNPTLLNKNFDKFIVLIKEAIKKGVFQMQFNVISSDILIKAKENPNFMPNLIVRVWGFSAYFNDLPCEYKDVLINRALQNEHKSI